MSKKQKYENYMNSLSEKEACEYYQENAFAYDGIEDYVHTDFSHYSKSDQDEIIKFIKKKLN